MQEYWHKLFECPFYVTNRRTEICCEVGTLTFDTIEATTGFMERACITNYRECPIYLSRQIDYDVEEENEKNKRRLIKGY